MFIALLIIAQVGGEWVQISQQHYRKPYHPTHNFPAQDPVTKLDETAQKTNRIYTNQSLSDYNWNKYGDEFHLKGTITRVQINEHENKRITHLDSDKSSAIKQTHHKYNSVKNTNVQNTGFVDSEEDVTNNYNYKFTQIEPNVQEGNIDHADKATTIEKYHNFNRYQESNHGSNRPSISESNEDVFEDTYHFIPKMGSVQRVQLDTRTVRTPIIITKPPRSEENYPPQDERNNESSYHNESNIQAMTDKSDKNKLLKDTIIKKVQDKHFVINAPNKPNSMDKGFQQNTDGIGAIQNNLNSKQTQQVNQFSDMNIQEPAFVTEEEEFNDESEAFVSNDPVTNVKDINTENPLMQSQTTQLNEAESPSGDENGFEANNTVSNENKANTMENIIKFMKIVADTIQKNTRRSVGSKIRYLQNLQDTILANIEHRIEATWPDEQTEGASRRKTRAAHETARGHVEFPSSESALMTISFLTFAVYLIKLILQVIQTYKNKTMMVAPTLVAVGRTVFAHRQPGFNSIH